MIFLIVRLRFRHACLVGYRPRKLRFQTALVVPLTFLRNPRGAPREIKNATQGGIFDFWQPYSDLNRDSRLERAVS